MKYRDWVNKNSAVVTIVAVVVLLLSLAYIVFQNQKPPPIKPIDVYYYDLKSTATDPLDRLFAAKSDSIPPIEAPSHEHMENGMPSGVKAAVYACGDCSDRSSLFIGYIETYTKEAREALEAMRSKAPEGRPPLFMGEDMMRGEQGHLLSRPGDSQLVPYGSEGALKIIQDIQEKCKSSGKPVKQCNPPKK